MADAFDDLRDLVNMSDADLLASVHDDEIDQLTATRRKQLARELELAMALAELRVEMDATKSEISDWLTNLRAELRAELRGAA